MNLDDPWGSPWADDVQHPFAEPKREVVSAPKPHVKAHLKEEVGIPPSPWGDSDDGFGDWSAVPAEGTSGDLGLDGASTSASGGVWDNAPRDRTARAMNEKDVPDEELNVHSMPWDESAAATTDVLPNLPGNLLAEPTPILREPSPDPWAKATTEDSASPLAGNSETFSTLEGATSEETLTVELPKDAEKSHTLPEQETHSVSDNPVEIERIMGNDVTVENVPEIIEPDEPSASQEVDLDSSRTSSSPSDHHDEILPESPRTSLDEGPKRSHTRQVSSNVHDLVVHFDRLAKSEVTEPETAQDTSIAKDLSEVSDHGNSPETENHDVQIEDEDEEGDDDDFGDFEEGNSDVDEEEAPSTPKHTASRGLDGGVMKTPTSTETTPQKPDPIKTFGRVEYKIDESRLGQIYSTAKEEDQVEKVFIPDVVPHDSFSSVEQRKTWYRISRYGTMRQHDAGDEDSYIRTSWKQSQVRAKTLNIVGRWMEEDRISGRVVLGGASKASSLFGWNDPNAAPVPLASAFSTKPVKKEPQVKALDEVDPEVPREWPKGFVRSPSSSKTHSPSKSRRRSSVKSPVEVKREPLPPIASFGWSSDTLPGLKTQGPVPWAKTQSTPPVPEPSTSTTKPPDMPDIVVPANITVQRPAPRVNGVSILTPTTQTPIAAVHPAKIVVPMPVAVGSVPDEDDDWGEMISTPAATVAPVFPTITKINKQAQPTSSVNQSLSKAFGNAPTSNETKKAPTVISDDLDPWASPNIGTTASFSPTTSSFDTFGTSSKVVQQTSKPYNGDTLDDLDPWETPKGLISTPTTTDPSMFDVLTKVPHTTDSTIDKQALPSAAPLTNATDPWASADFSFFDSAPAPAPTITAKPMVVPKARANPKKSVNFKTSTLSTKHVPSPLSQYTTTGSLPIAKPHPSPARPGGRSKAEIEQDRIVAEIIKGLPDLSYMLRK